MYLTLKDKTQHTNGVDTMGIDTGDTFSYILLSICFLRFISLFFRGSQLAFRNKEFAVHGEHQTAKTKYQTPNLQKYNKK